MRGWTPKGLLRLAYDLDEQSVNGVPIGAAIEAARALGRPDYLSSGPDPDMSYYRLGLQVDCYEGEIVGFRLVLDPVGRAVRRDHSFHPGRIILRGVGALEFEVSPATHERDFIARFGQPVETRTVGNDRVQTFLVVGNCIETFHDPSTGLVVEVEFAAAADTTQPER